MQDTLINGQEVYVFAPERYKLPDYLTYESYDKLKVVMEEDSSLSIENPYDNAFLFGPEGLGIDLLLYKDKKVVKTLKVEIDHPISISADDTTNLGISTSIPSEIVIDGFGFSVRKDPWPGAAVYYRYDVSR